MDLSFKSLSNQNIIQLNIRFGESKFQHVALHGKKYPELLIQFHLSSYPSHIFFHFLLRSALYFMLTNQQQWGLHTEKKMYKNFLQTTCPFGISFLLRFRCFFVSFQSYNFLKSSNLFFFLSYVCGTNLKVFFKIFLRREGEKWSGRSWDKTTRNKFSNISRSPCALRSSRLLTYQ